MQVKKFEAKSMKEALEMVKTQLGPDAIILSAKDNRRSFGLLSNGSIEVTAAVPETTLLRKKIAEAKIPPQHLAKYQKSSARSQRQFIDAAMAEKPRVTAAPPVARKNITETRYVDIGDEQPIQPAGRNVSDLLTEIERTETRASTDALRETAINRIRSAAKSALEAAQTPPETASISRDEEVLSLKREIHRLREVIEGFKKMPQTILSTYPSAGYGLSYETNFMFEKLQNAGIRDELAVDLLRRLESSVPKYQLKNRPMIEGWVARTILEQTKVISDHFGGKTHLFVGPPGSGKTTILVKIASHLVIKESKRIAILTTDVNKVGAVDQLRIYAQILNVPFGVIRSKDDWEAVGREMQGVDTVLVDFPGLQLKESAELYLLESLLPPTKTSVVTHLVQSACVKDEDATESGKRYGAASFRDVIFTRLDEAAQHGVIYNFQKDFQVPLHSYGIGAKVPEDFEVATKERLLDLVFKLTHIASEKRS